MVINLYIHFLIFLFFSFLGYIVECIYSSIIQRELNVDRGFFMGPYLPIYGITLTLIYHLTNNISFIFVQFIITFFLIFIIEYITSFVLEKIFKRRWWDYSRKKYNINGRVCLDNLIIFSISSIYISNCLIPNIILFLEKDMVFTKSFGVLSFVIFLFDLLFSCLYNYKDCKNTKK